MIVHQGIYLPDGERHLVDWMTRAGELVDGRGTYQIGKLRAALRYVAEDCRRVAVDVGAHVGLWSMQLAKCFDQVHAFEPVAAHRDCFVRNLDGGNGSRVTLHDCALGEVRGWVRMDSAPTSSGDTRIGEVLDSGIALSAVGHGASMLRRLDEFSLTEVDFIKLDCEGYELHALRGGVDTIRRSLPVIIVEQKPGRAQRFGLAEHGAVDWLEQEFGYRCVQELSGDFILVPAGRV